MLTYQPQWGEEPSSPLPMSSQGWDARSPPGALVFAPPPLLGLWPARSCDVATDDPWGASLSCPSESELLSAAGRLWPAVEAPPSIHTTVASRGCSSQGNLCGCSLSTIIRPFRHASELEKKGRVVTASRKTGPAAEGHVLPAAEASSCGAALLDSASLQPIGRFRRRLGVPSVEETNVGAVSTVACLSPSRAFANTGELG